MTLGRVSGVFGVRGWVRVQSYTRPAGNLFEYGDWDIAGRTVKVLEWREQGRGFVVRLEGVTEREPAAALAGSEIQVLRSVLPPLSPGEYYWADLVGCEVVGNGGAVLGRVVGLLDNTAQDVLVVQGERERLVPFVVGPIVQSVDLGARRIEVAWDADD